MPPDTGEQPRVKQPWHSEDPYHYTVPKPGEPWKHCRTLVQDYDKGMLEAWKDEVDKLLIFAGLFSAAVTAFTIESSKWLQEDRTDPSTRIVLEELLQEFRRTSLPSPNLQVSNNVTETISGLSSSVVRINIFWFLSLTLSLTTVLIGILCMQWIREYHRDAHINHKDAIALRQMRYEGFLKWKVPTILSSLPLLLQSAVVLFFAGLLELLWSLNRFVAIFVTAAVSLAMTFLALTTIVPFFQYIVLGERDFHAAQCAYKSPQSWAFFRLGLRFLWLATWSTEPIKSISSSSAFNFLKIQRSLHDQSWIEYDLRQWRRLRGLDDLIHGITWIDEVFTQSLDAVYSVYHCLSDMDIPSAAQAVSDLNPGAADRLNLAMGSHTFQLASQKRDNINASFLELHHRAHPTLGASYLEAIIRILNTQDDLPFVDWPVRDILTFPHDIVEQFLMSISSMVARDLVTAPNAIIIWALVQRLLERSVWGSGDLESYSELVVAIMGQFEQWVPRFSPGLDQKDRVSICVYGMVKVFRPSFDFYSGGKKYPGLETVVSLVLTLNEYMEKGVIPEALTPYVRQRWEELVVRCVPRDWPKIETSFDGFRTDADTAKD